MLLLPPDREHIFLTVRCVMMLKRERNGQNQNKQPAEVGGPSPGMAIAQGEGLSKHMRKRVRVGRTGGKGALVTGRGICLQRRVGSLVFNAVLAPGPVNRPAFPFSCGAKGESKMDQTKPVPGSGAAHLSTY